MVLDNKRTSILRGFWNYFPILAEVLFVWLFTTKERELRCLCIVSLIQGY